MKKYVLIAGVNGAGKSTLYSSEEKLWSIEKINLDEVVRSIGDWHNSDDVVKAGKIVLKRIDEYFNRGISFSQETTLCGKSIMKDIDRARSLGYLVEMYYVGLKSPELAKERIKYRVLQGGHGISDKDVERRYIESLRKMREVIPLCDKVYVYDNTNGFKRIAIYKNGECVHTSQMTPEWFKEALKE
jgi:predicted ABC-type ATPase